MNNWGDILIWLRHYLRDPNGVIYTDAELLQYYNDASREVAVKSGLNVRVETYAYPPEYDESYTYDWEVEFGEGTKYQALTINQADGHVITYPWESAYWLDIDPTGDDGYRDTHPWEMTLGTPADYIPLPLHAKFSKMKLAAYDEWVIRPIDESDLAQQDGWYRTRTGRPVNYWRPDQVQNYLVLYPHPDPITPDTVTVLDDEFGLVDSEAWLDHGDTGLTIDVVELENSLFMAYESLPEDLESNVSVPDIVPYLIKYNCYATLERAYGADTDGFIPTLRDYWGMRKKVGIEAIKKWRRLATTRQDIRIGGSNAKVVGRHPRLPSHYPRVI